MSANRTIVPLPINGQMNMLTRAEIDALLDVSQNGLYERFRRCVLAVLNTGADSDNVNEILNRNRDFSVNLVQRAGAVVLEFENAPPEAFVDGQIMVGIKEHLHVVLRDILYIHNELAQPGRFDLDKAAHITDAVFHILRNARALRPGADSRVVVCWGGHSIPRDEYDYTKLVGYELGLRGMDICTGCGPGAMKGPMKGATIGHAKMRTAPGRYVGISEPGIIAAEAPNPIVNELIITPDIEMRLEAFLRLGHGFLVFPGGVGTAEELFYILGILLDPANQGDAFPLVLTGPPSAAAYFEEINSFVGATLGTEAQSKYEIVIDDPVLAARRAQEGIERARVHRSKNNDAGYFHWQLNIDERFQFAFEPTHGSMAALQLSTKLPPNQLAANLRRAFSGVVAANIKQSGQSATSENPFVICGDAAIITPLQNLLGHFVEQGRMTLQPNLYSPCYRFECNAAA